MKNHLACRSKAEPVVMSPAFDGSTVISAAFVPLGPEVFATDSAKREAAAAFCDWSAIECFGYHRLVLTRLSRSNLTN